MAEQATLPHAVARVSDAALPKISGYELLREKGRGPKAVVYKARRVFENDTVAVKLFHRGVCDRTMAAKLEAGVQKTAELVHPGLIRSLGFGSDNGHSFFVMEYASGESLSNFLFRQQQFPPAKALSVILHFARTLKFCADKNFFHGRLHPGRVILGRNAARIAGVGMNERPEHAAWTVQYSHFFEPLVYTAPEAMPTKTFPENNIAPVDIYSLGAILFHVLTCTPPFKGSDEASLEAERRNMKGALEWPGDSRGAYVPELVALVEKMLDAEPAKRPDYDSLIASLSKLQADAQKSNADAWHPSESVAPIAASSHGNLTALFSDTGKAPATPTQIGKAEKTSGAASSSSVPMAATALHSDSKRADASRQSRRTPIVVPRRSGSDVFFSTLLICMTATVFLGVAYVTAQPYLPEKYQYFKKLLPHAESTAQNGSATNGATKPGTSDTGAAKVPVEPLVDPTEELIAQRQLEKLREMLRSGEIKYSPGVVKTLRAIADRAGKTSQTAINALILAGNVEDQIAPKPPDTPPPAAKTDTPAPKVEAPAPKTEAAKTPPVPEKPPENVVPPKPPETPKAPNAFAAAVAQSRTQLKYFGYSKAKEFIEQFAAKGDAEQKRDAADFQTLINYEEGLYERCRAKLLDQIKKHPKHESPLQLFPRKDDPVGDDIIDFDDKGLHILVRGGANKGVKITPWDKFPPAQVLNLLLPLATQNSLDDQLGIAVFAFNRGLQVEAAGALSKAEQLPNGKEKATAIGDLFTKITRALDAP